MHQPARSSGWPRSCGLKEGPRLATGDALFALARISVQARPIQRCVQRCGHSYSAHWQVLEPHEESGVGSRRAN